MNKKIRERMIISIWIKMYDSGQMLFTEKELKLMSDKDLRDLALTFAINH